MDVMKRCVCWKGKSRGHLSRPNIFEFDLIFSLHTTVSKTTTYDVSKDCDGCVETNWQPIQTGNCGDIKYKLSYKTNNNDGGGDFHELSDKTSVRHCGQDSISNVTLTTIFDDKEYVSPHTPMAIPGCVSKGICYTRNYSHCGIF